MTAFLVLLTLLSVGGWLLLVNGLGVHSDEYQPRHRPPT